GSELVAVMRRNGALARDYAARHRVPKWYDDADALINDPDVNAVYVATPPGSHCESALKVCAAGKPAYVEKPMARNLAECKQMVGAFHERGLPLFVAYYRRALPRFLKAKELIDLGRLGTISSVDYVYEEPLRPLPPAGLPWRFDPEQSGGGLFFDLGSHALDILDFLIGPLTDVAGCASNLSGAYAVEDNVVMQFRTESKIRGTASWNFAGLDRRDEVRFVGADGRMTLSVFGNDPVSVEDQSGTETIELLNPRHIQQPLIQSVVDDLLGRGACPSTGGSAARTSLVMDRVTCSFFGSRDWGFWNCPEEWPGSPRKGLREAGADSSGSGVSSGGTCA
ncbi:MAG: Gfo/Idh/MocA family protein, partial [Planctomycetaceae bacterium]